MKIFINLKKSIIKLSIFCCFLFFCFYLKPIFKNINLGFRKKPKEFLVKNVDNEKNLLNFISQLKNRYEKLKKSFDYKEVEDKINKHYNDYNNERLEEIDNVKIDLYSKLKDLITPREKQEIENFMTNQHFGINKLIGKDPKINFGKYKEEVKGLDIIYRVMLQLAGEELDTYKELFRILYSLRMNGKSENELEECIVEFSHYKKNLVIKLKNLITKLFSEMSFKSKVVNKEKKAQEIEQWIEEILNLYQRYLEHSFYYDVNAKVANLSELTNKLTWKEIFGFASAGALSILIAAFGVYKFKDRFKEKEDDKKENVNEEKNNSLEKEKEDLNQKNQEKNNVDENVDEKKKNKEKENDKKEKENDKKEELNNNNNKGEVNEQQSKEKLDQLPKKEENDELEKKKEQIEKNNQKLHLFNSIFRESYEELTKYRDKKNTLFEGLKEGFNLLRKDNHVISEKDKLIFNLISTKEEEFIREKDKFDFIEIKQENDFFDILEEVYIRKMYEKRKELKANIKNLNDKEQKDLKELNEGLYFKEEEVADGVEEEKKFLKKFKKDYIKFKEDLVIEKEKEDLIKKNENFFNLINYIGILLKEYNRLFADKNAILEALYNISDKKNNKQGLNFFEKNDYVSDEDIFEYIIGKIILVSLMKEEDMDLKKKIIAEKLKYFELDIEKLKKIKNEYNEFKENKFNSLKTKNKKQKTKNKK